MLVSESNGNSNGNGNGNGKGTGTRLADAVRAMREEMREQARRSEERDRETQARLQQVSMQLQQVSMQVQHAQHASVQMAPMHMQMAPMQMQPMHAPSHAPSHAHTHAHAPTVPMLMPLSTPASRPRLTFGEFQDALRTEMDVGEAGMAKITTDYTAGFVSILAAHVARQREGGADAPLKCMGRRPHMQAFRAVDGREAWVEVGEDELDRFFRRVMKAILARCCGDAAPATGTADCVNRIERNAHIAGGIETSRFRRHARPMLYDAML